MVNVFIFWKIWALQVKSYAVYISLHVVPKVQSFQKQQQKL